MNRRRVFALAIAALLTIVCLCPPGAVPLPLPTEAGTVPAPASEPRPTAESAGMDGASGGDLPVECSGVKGNVNFPGGSFDGIIQFTVQCLEPDDIGELSQKVKEATGGTGVVLGAMRVEPSPFQFYKEVRLTIPLTYPHPELAKHFVDLWVAAPNRAEGVEKISQAIVSEDGWNAEAVVDHFTTFVVVVIASSMPVPIITPMFTPTAAQGFTPTSMPFTCPDALGCAVYKPGEPIRIAALLTFSNNAEYQERSKAALTGMEEAAKDPPSIAGHPILIETFDDQAEPLVSMNQMEKITGNPQIAGMVGAIYVGRYTTLPKLDSANYTLVSSGNTSPVFTQAGERSPGFFRVSPSATAEAKALAIFAYQQGHRRVGIAYQNSDTFKAMLEAFESEFERQGGTVVAAEEVSPYNPDYKGILYKISDRKADAIYFPLEALVGADMASLAHDMFGYNVRLFGTTEMYNNDNFVKKAGVGAIGMYYPSVTPSVIARAKDYGYDAMAILLRAISASYMIGPDGALYIGREALRKSMTEIYNFPGRTGFLACNQYGDCANPTVVIYMYRKGEFEKVGSVAPGN